MQIKWWNDACKHNENKTHENREIFICFSNQSTLKAFSAQQCVWNAFVYLTAHKMSRAHYLIHSMVERYMLHAKILAQETHMRCKKMWTDAYCQREHCTNSHSQHQHFLWHFLTTSRIESKDKRMTRISVVQNFNSEKINSVVTLNGDRSAAKRGSWHACRTWDALHVQTNKLLALLLKFLFLPLGAITTAVGDDFGDFFEKIVQEKLRRLFGVDGIQKQFEFMNVFVGDSQRSLAGPGVTVTGKNREHVYKCHFYFVWCVKKTNSESCLKIFCLKTINVKMEAWCDDDSRSRSQDTIWRIGSNFLFIIVFWAEWLFVMAIKMRLDITNFGQHKFFCF